METLGFVLIFAGIIAILGGFLWVTCGDESVFSGFVILLTGVTFLTIGMCVGVDAFDRCQNCNTVIEFPDQKYCYECGQCLDKKDNKKELVSEKESCNIPTSKEESKKVPLSEEIIEQIHSDPNCNCNCERNQELKPDKGKNNSTTDSKEDVKNFCSNCGEKVIKDNSYCGKCGNKY